MTMMKRVTISEIAIFCNIGPILTVFIGGLFLKKENINLITVITVCIFFIGVMMIISGKKKTIEMTKGPDFAHENAKMEFHLWYYAVMSLVPIFIAIENFTLGYLRDKHPKFLVFYK